MVIAGLVISFPLIYADDGGIIELLEDMIFVPEGMKELVDWRAI